MLVEVGLAGCEEGRMEEEMGWDKDDEVMLQLARQGLRDYVVGNDWAPDVDAVESRHKGMVLRGTEARIITVSKMALRKYRAEGIILLKRFVRESSGQEIEYGPALVLNQKPMDFVVWLVGQKERISKATWRAYKQAGLWIVERWPDAAVDLVERASAYQ